MSTPVQPGSVDPTKGRFDLQECAGRSAPHVRRWIEAAAASSFGYERALDTVSSVLQGDPFRREHIIKGDELRKQ